MRDHPATLTLYDDQVHELRIINLALTAHCNESLASIWRIIPIYWLI